MSWREWWFGKPHILCGQCTLIFPSPNQRKPQKDEQCEVCGDEGK